MIQNVVACEYDGREMRTLTVSFEIPDASFNLMRAVCKAATDFCNTAEGRKIYSYNCRNFNLADFETSVPNSFCEKYGFRKVDSYLSDIVIGWDEELVDDFAIEFGDEEER